MRGDTVGDGGGGAVTSELTMLNKIVSDRVDALEAKVKRLRNALCKYGVHANDCPAGDWSDAAECNCGFAKAEEVGP